MRATPQAKKGMAMTIVEGRRVTGGVDTHLDLHVAAALDDIGGLLGVEEFPTTGAGYKKLLKWMAGFGPIQRVGIEGTGSYGAGLARHLQQAGVCVVEVNRPDRQDRHTEGVEQIGINAVTNVVHFARDQVHDRPGPLGGER